jgi:hypothetical protein
MLMRSSKLITVCSIALIIFWLSSDAQAQAERSSRTRQVNAAPAAAEVTVTLNEQFLNAFLDTMFTRLRAPQFPLSLTSAEPQPEVRPATTVSNNSDATHHPASLHLKEDSKTRAEAAQCSSVIVLEREVSGVRTAVRFENGKITAPLAFSGSYAVALLGCIRFQGWAETTIRLDFDRARQSLSANVEVQDIHLNGVPGLASGVILSLVQNSIDSRINPVEILPASQLSARIPIAAAGGALRLVAKEVRPEVVPGALRLHIMYEFAPAD